MNRLQEKVWAASRRARQKRARIFRQRFDLNETTRVLDIGSENGENINLVLTGTSVAPENVFIADIEAEAINFGRERFGYQTILLDESGRLPFADGEFDVVYCSSVIEHVIVAKSEIWQITNESEFRRAAWANQKKIAAEIRRVGKSFLCKRRIADF